MTSVSEWFEALKAELLARSPYREAEYFKRFRAGALTKDQAWAHVAQNFLIVQYFPRIFSGIHARCDDLEVRKECAKHLLVEDLGYFHGQIGGTPDHLELYKRIGDDMGYGRDVYDRLEPLPETAVIIEFCRRLSHEIPWNAALCTTALFEAEVIELSRNVGSGLAEHYGCRPEWGGWNYIVHVEVEQEESEDTEKAILQHIRTDADRRAAEGAMRTLHGLLEAYADALTRTYAR
ncbi:MAG: TenA family transcriptional regulator [Candidatus Rokuibacteriota bacterium]